MPTLRLAFVGFNRSGKSSFVRCITDEEIGTSVTHYAKDYTVKFPIFDLIITDTPSSSHHMQLFPDILSDKDAIFIVCDVTEKNSYDPTVIELVNMIEESHLNCKIYVMINKQDKQPNIQKIPPIIDELKMKNRISNFFATSTKLSDKKEENYQTAKKIKEIIYEILPDFLPENYLPSLSCNFPLDQVQNLIAYANGYTFLLTENALGVKNTINGEMKERWNPLPPNAVYRPVFMKANCDGSSIIIGLHYSLYLIHEDFTPDDFLAGIHELKLSQIQIDFETPQIYIDLEFFPTSPDYFAIAFESGLIRIMKIEGNNCIPIYDFNTNIPLLSMRFAPIDVENGWLRYALFYLTQDSRVYMILPLLLPGISIEPTLFEEFESTREYQRSKYLFEGDGYLIPPPYEIDHDIIQSAVESFDFSQDYMFFSTRDGEIRWTDLSKITPGMENKKFDTNLCIKENIPNSPIEQNTSNISVKLISNPNLYGITSDKVIGFVKSEMNNQVNFTYNQLIRLNEAGGLLGVGGIDNLCLVHPGYLIPLRQCFIGFNRFDPRLIYNVEDENIRFVMKRMDNTKRIMKDYLKSISMAPNKLLSNQEAVERKINHIKEEQTKYTEQSKAMEAKSNELLKKSREIKDRAAKILSELKSQILEQTKAEQILKIAIQTTDTIYEEMKDDVENVQDYYKQ